MQGHEITGVICALVTPFDAGGEVDLDATCQLIDFHCGHGTDGLFLLGTSGEGLLLAPEERMAVTERALGYAAGRIPVVVHCGATDTRSAVRLAEHAERHGADAIAATGPLFFAYQESEIVEHFRRIAEAAPGTDLFVYENPARVGYSLPVALIGQLVSNVTSIVGVKDTGASVGRLGAYQTAEKDMVVFTGDNTMLLAALVTGAAGLVSTTSNVTPELFAGIVSAFAAGDLAAARERQLVATRLQAAVSGLPYVAAVEWLMRTRGLPAGTGRREPMRRLTADQEATLRVRVGDDPDLSDWLAGHAS
ncbi:MAG: dihydrodipicolinate synthase family protein [Streptosporangiaceae bacterium]